MRARARLRRLEVPAMFRLERSPELYLCHQAIRETDSALHQTCQ